MEIRIDANKSRVFQQDIEKSVIAFTVTEHPEWGTQQVIIDNGSPTQQEITSAVTARVNQLVQVITDNNSLRDMLSSWGGFNIG
jgi:muramoyltetrapeptide carboxypeptidase LdcA involved in peptidoglycan recycling